MRRAPLALLCDAVGTLIQTREPPAQSYVRFARQHGIACEPEAVGQRLRSALAAHRAPTGDPQMLPDRERAGWRELVRACLGDAAADGRCFDALFAFYATGAAWEALPGAAQALDTARTRGLRTAVASNMDHRLPGVLAELGLAPRLDATVIPSSCGFAKPDPRFFLAACARVEAAPAACLYLGDREPDCVAAARAAGLQALRYDPEASRPDTLHGWHNLARQLS